MGGRHGCHLWRSRDAPRRERSADEVRNGKTSHSFRSRTPDRGRAGNLFLVSILEVGVTVYARHADRPTHVVVVVGGCGAALR